MPATYPAATIFLEAHFFADVREELRLPCDAVTVDRDGILVQGIETRHLAALHWSPDLLSFQSYQHQLQFPVKRPSIIDGLTARFPLRQRSRGHGAAQ